MTKAIPDKTTVLLLYPKLGINPLRPQPPLSLLMLAPYLEDKGLKPVIIDQRIDPNYAEHIRALLPRTLFVGITSITGEQLRYARELISLVKTLSPGTPVVFGGIHASLLPEQAVRAEGVDIVAVGEGEGIIPDLVDYFQNKIGLSAVAGIYYRAGDRVIATPPRELMDPALLKMPAWHLVDCGSYTDITVQTGRGCPHGCSFCYNQKFNAMRWRPRPTASILEEIRFLYEKQGVREFHFVDDNFFTDFPRALELCRLIVENSFGIRWKCSFRADYAKMITPEIAALLLRSGLQLLFVGGESGSPAILKKINKDISVEDIILLSEVAEQCKLPLSISFMAGFPYESAGERAMTYDLMDRIRRINPAMNIEGVNIYTPYPGNALFETSKRHGLLEPASLEDWSTYVFNSSNLPWFSKAETRMIENVSFISRFIFWNREIERRFLKARYYPFYLLLRWSAAIRWKMRLFKGAIEWNLFRRALRRIRQN